MKIFGVVEGPHEVEDDAGDTLWSLVVKSNYYDEKKVEDIQIYLDSFDNAYWMKKYFDKNIEPLEFEDL